MRTLMFLVLALVLGACASPSPYHQMQVIGAETPMNCKTTVTEMHEHVRCEGRETLAKANALNAAREARLRNARAWDERHSRPTSPLIGVEIRTGYPRVITRGRFDEHRVRSGDKYGARGATTHRFRGGVGCCR